MYTSKVSLNLPTSTSPPRIQKIVGRPSPLSLDIEEFRGVPYASIPARWQHSILNQELPSDIFDATQNGPKCPQPSGPNNSDTFQAHLDFPSDVAESEFECLNLFIQRPSQDALRKIGKENDPLPVFVWIHGGGFGFGAATDPMLDPTRLVLQSITLRTPIIAISINYRLNVFGFLATPYLASVNTKGCNFGLQDQHQALKWISHNIAHFGGDRDKITIAGQSAGGASTHVHVLNARTDARKPLFRRAIAMSGSMRCLGPCEMAKAEIKWDTMCKHLNAEGSPEERLEKLREMETRIFVEMSWNLGWMGFDSVIDGISIVTPPEKEHECLISFYDDEKTEISANEQPVNVLIGEASQEGSVFVADVLPKITSFAQVSAIFHATYPSPTSASDVLSAYSLTPSTSLSDIHEGIIQFVSDTIFGFAASLAMNLMRQKFDNERDITVEEYSTQYGNPFPGSNFGVAHHCVDLIYVFDAFHDYLAEADKKEAAKEDGTYQAKQTNAELTLRMQKDWLEFITKDQVDDGSGEREGKIKIYGHDRVVREEQLEVDEHWVQQKKRFDVLKREFEFAKMILWKLRAI